MRDLARAEDCLGQILGLERRPVAVSFVRSSDPLPTGFAVPSGRWYCQVLMEAGRGRKELLTPDNTACPASAAALGFKRLPEKLQTGEMLAAYGILASK